MSTYSVSSSGGFLSYFANFTHEPENTSYLTFALLPKDQIMMDVINSVVSSFLDKPWIGSVFGSIVVSLSGVLPLLFIHNDEGEYLNKGVAGHSLKVLLSFAVGGLLGDVFLHLLPEAWSLQDQYTNGNPSMFCGMWVLIGLLLFIIVEKVFSLPNPYETEVVDKTVFVDDKCPINNNYDDKSCTKQNSDTPMTARSSHQKVAGYLNLIANSIDNFTHGLAVGGSFLLSPKVGILTTFAILIHEVPHEIGDFAILLRAGFSRWEAARAQLLTGAAGLVGALTAVMCSGADTTMEAKTSWILPFTAGGFLHISLVTVLPELLEEESPWESIKQLLSLVSGVVLMAILTAICQG